MFLKMVAIVFTLYFSLNFVSAVYDSNPFLNSDQSPTPAVIGNELQSPTAPTQKPQFTQKPPEDGNYAVTTKPTKPTTEPIFTIEPPWILHGGKCLKPRGQFPSDSCNKYVNCWDGYITEETCPGNFLFNPKGNYCDFPENVKCNKKTTTETSDKSIPTTILPTSSFPLFSTSPTLVVASSALTPNAAVGSPSVSNSRGPTLRALCLKPRGQFPSYSCSKYINCWDDSVVEQECPEGLMFSAKGYCDFAENVDCYGRSLHGLTSHKKEGPECPLEHGTFRDRTNCSQYFTCLQNKVVAKYKCPVGFSFSDNLGVCDYSYRVDCSKEPLIYHTKNTSSEVPTDLDCSVEYGIYRDRINCRKYYICVSKRVIAQHECPIGYNFNDNLGSCDYANNVDCQQPPKVFQIRATSYVPQLSTDIMQKVQKCQPGVVFRLNPQCTAACRCTNGLAEIIRCSEGLAYDSALDKCIPLNLAKC